MLRRPPAVLGLFPVSNRRIVEKVKSPLRGGRALVARPSPAFPSRMAGAAGRDRGFSSEKDDQSPRKGCQCHQAGSRPRLKSSQQLLSYADSCFLLMPLSPISRISAKSGNRERWGTDALAFRVTSAVLYCQTVSNFTSTRGRSKRALLCALAL